MIHTKTINMGGHPNACLNKIAIKVLPETMEHTYVKVIHHQMVHVIWTARDVIIQTMIITLLAVPNSNKTTRQFQPNVLILLYAMLTHQQLLRISVFQQSFNAMLTLFWHPLLW